jgi:phosphoglycerate dehydrogenase-like enzyme
MTVSTNAVQIRLPRAARAFVLGPISMSVRSLIESADLQVCVPNIGNLNITPLLIFGFQIVEFKYSRIQDVLSACRTCQILIINQHTIDTQCSALTSLPHWVAIANLKNNECDFHTAGPVFRPESLASSFMARSVAELVIGQIFNLARQLPNRPGFEIRNKTLGIIGYGSVGVQVSYMAEALGMRVMFYDTDYVMHYGRAKSVASLSELLGQSDIITLHVPTHTSTILNEKHLLHMMRKGSYIIDASHSRALDRQALELALNQQHLHGAALDRPLAELEGSSKVQNLLLTYDLRYSTQEVQDAMAISSLTQLLDYLKQVAHTMSTLISTDDLAMDSPATKMALAK